MKRTIWIFALLAIIAVAAFAVADHDKAAQREDNVKSESGKTERVGSDRVGAEQDSAGRDSAGRDSAERDSAEGDGTACDGTARGKVVKDDAEWREELDEMEYYVLREKGTERAFTGEFSDFKGDGVYVCAACGAPLFDSQAKYDSGSGWPSYWQPIAKDQVTLVEDNTLGMQRTEVLCSRCQGHLGHVFDDGPEPTGLRYCINSASLDFEPREE